MSQLCEVRIVLVETSHPGNIGSCARAMKTMGVSALYLVAPKHFPDPVAVELAAGADDILAAAVVVPTLEEALQGCQIVVMSSARDRSIDLPQRTPRAMMETLKTESTASSIAFVFGRERTGLTNAELLLGHYHLVIPANPAYSSLNLAQAVQIVVYEFRVAFEQAALSVSSKTPVKLASHEAMENFYTHLFTVLLEIDFLKPAAPRRMTERLRRLFGRTQLEAMEVDLLRGMLTRVQYQLGKKDS